MHGTQFPTSPDLALLLGRPTGSHKPYDDSVLSCSAWSIGPQPVTPSVYQWMLSPWEVAPVFLHLHSAVWPGIHWQLMMYEAASVVEGKCMYVYKCKCTYCGVPYNSRRRPYTTPHCSSVVRHRQLSISCIVNTPSGVSGNGVVVCLFNYSRISYHHWCFFHRKTKTLCLP